MATLFPADQPMREAAKEGLRRVLSNEATSVPTRTPRRTKRRVLVSGVAATVAAIFALNAGPAAVAWTPAPASLTKAQTATLGDACAKNIASKHFPMGFTSPRPLLSEARGSFQAVLLSDAEGHAAICVSQSVASVAWRFAGLYDIGPLSGAITLDAVGGQIGGIGDTRFAFGRVTTNVISVHIATQDGRDIAASVARGRFLAWWPSGANVTSITAMTGSGESVSVPLPSPQPLAPTPSHR